MNEYLTIDIQPKWFEHKKKKINSLKFCFNYAQNFDNYFEDIDITDDNIFEHAKWSVEEDFSYWEGE